MVDTDNSTVNIPEGQMTHDKNMKTKKIVPFIKWPRV